MNTPVLRLAPLLLASTVLAGSVHAQLAVDNTFTPAALVNDILVGQGITVSNLTFNGLPANTANDQIGAFDGTSSNIGLAGGVVLATGRVVAVTGSNQNTSLTLSPSAPVNTPDPDLALIETPLRCVAVLEFDFIPTGDSLSFRFVFGSEEYPEYVCSQYNDVFGFFLSGPGINGPFTNDAINLGVLPNTTVPIAINTVNGGVPGVLGGGPGGCNASDPNWEANAVYYVDNTGGATVELDGFTVPIRTGAAVQCGETYHIKIAIAHAGDASLESAVFIEGGSFSSANDLILSVTTPQGNGTLTEGCGQAAITVERTGSSDEADVQLTYSGGGHTPSDLIDAPTSVTIPQGASSAAFSLVAARDDEAEGAEPLIITATWTGSCGTVSTSATIQLLDHDPIIVEANDLLLDCDLDSALLVASASGGLGDLSLVWSNGDTGSSTYVLGMENGTYTITVTDECPETEVISVNVSAGCEINVPNVITPNGDGHNDAWVIDGIHRGPHSVKVFNRWGQVVFESTSYANNWRGTDLPDGTYFYEVLSDRASGPLVGSLTILSNARR